MKTLAALTPMLFVVQSWTQAYGPATVNKATLEGIVILMLLGALLGFIKMITSGRRLR